MRVFLSYDARDREYAAKLAESLSREGFDVWYAHAQLYPGDNWPLKTGKASRKRTLWWCCCLQKR